MAERAVEQLKNAGFRDDQIGFVARDQGAGQGTTATGETAETGTTGERAAAGAVGGGILGGIIGAAAALLIPGIGPVVAGGILATTLAGAAVGAAAGGLLGALTKMGVPEEEARYYESEFQAGRTIVTVQPDGRQQEALDILRRNGAYDATTRPATAAYGATGAGATAGRPEQMQAASMGQTQPGQMATGRWEDVSPSYRNYWQQRYGNQGRWEDFEPAYRYGWEMKNNPQYRGRSWTQVESNLRRDWESRFPNRPWAQASTALRESWEADMGTQEARRVPIREEELRATKQPVEAGEVRIGKEVVTEERTINVPVQREQVYIEQRDVATRPADRPISEEGETIRVPVREEEVRVEKQPVVTGEVVIGKQQVQDTEQYTDTVRREEARIEREGDVDIHGSEAGGTEQYPADRPD
jgi:uncharacterized protein (TIGR02271 family)